jgi:hypothetical protein
MVLFIGVCIEIVIFILLGLLLPNGLVIIEYVVVVFITSEREEIHIDMRMIASYEYVLLRGLDKTLRVFECCGGLVVVDTEYPLPPFELRFCCKDKGEGRPCREETRRNPTT